MLQPTPNQIRHTSVSALHYSTLHCPTLPYLHGGSVAGTRGAVQWSDVLAAQLVVGVGARHADVAQLAIGGRPGVADQPVLLACTHTHTHTHMEGDTIQ